MVVCEISPVRALEAKMDGFEVMKGVEAARKGDVFISVTGGRDAMAGPHFDVMKDGAIVCNAGHFDVEINLGDLRQRAQDSRRVRPNVEQFTLRDGRKLNLLAEGRLVNLAAAEGHPAAVMDMSFANQALSAEHLVRHHESLEIEVRNADEIEQALAAKAPRLLLDNMNDTELRAAVSQVAGRASLEASGGVTLQTLRARAATGVEWISMGALTHSAPALDLSLTMEAPP